MAHKNLKESETNSSIVAVKHLTNISPEFNIIVDKTDIINFKPNKKISMFSALVRSVISQQLNGKVSRKIFLNLIDNLTEDNTLKPRDFIDIDLSKLQSCGLSKSKSICIKEIAEAVIKKDIPSTKKMSILDDEEIIQLLTKIKGIGRWTAEMILIFKLGRKDILPLNDVGVLKGYDRLFNNTNNQSILSIENISKKWEPYRSYATLYLYKAADTLDII